MGLDAANFRRAVAAAEISPLMQIIGTTPQAMVAYMMRVGVEAERPAART